MKRKRLNLNQQELSELYYGKNMSLTDIGKYYGCSRQNIYYAFESLRIPLRDKSMAREIVYKKNKIKVNREYDKNIFKEWSPKMAYLLGLIFTDGNIAYNQGKNKLYKRFSFSQTNVDFFNKVCRLFSFSGKTYLNKTNQCQTMYISNVDMVNDLEKLGLHPNKSLDIKFPEVPNEYVSHFIRGIFDGDGSKMQNRLTIVSASKKFLESIYEVLKKNDIESKFYSYQYYTLRINKKSEINKFFNFIYKDKGDMYFEKKYLKFYTDIESRQIKLQIIKDLS